MEIAEAATTSTMSNSVSETEDVIMRYFDLEEPATVPTVVTMEKKESKATSGQHGSFTSELELIMQGRKFEQDRRAKLDQEKSPKQAYTPERDERSNTSTTSNTTADTQQTKEARPKLAFASELKERFTSVERAEELPTKERFSSVEQTEKLSTIDQDKAKDSLLEEKIPKVHNPAPQPNFRDEMAQVLKRRNEMKATEQKGGNAHEDSLLKSIERYKPGSLPPPVSAQEKLEKREKQEKKEKLHQDMLLKSIERFKPGSLPPANTNTTNTYSHKELFKNHKDHKLAAPQDLHYSSPHIRGEKFEADERLEKSVKALSKITGLPMPRMTPFEQKKFIDDAINWLRKNDPANLDTVDDETADIFMNLAGMIHEGQPITPDSVVVAAMGGENQTRFLQDPISPAMSTYESPALTFSETNYVTPEKPNSDATAATKEGGKLSELAKQLRSLQAQNKSQSNEVERMERKLRIVSDLKGVSVMDLRGALQVACNKEAHNELRNQVLSLQGQLEAIKAKKTIQTSNNIHQESALREIAHLQLRVGELEEIEETLRKELKALYKSLQEKTHKTTKLEAAGKQQDFQVQEYQQQLQSNTKDIDALKKSRSNLMIANGELMEKLRKAELDLKVERENSNSLSNQIQLIKKLDQDRSAGRFQFNRNPSNLERSGSTGSFEGYEADEELMAALSKITGLAVPRKMTPAQKKKFVLDSIDHLRKNDPAQLHAVDDKAAIAFTNLAGVEIDSRPTSKQERKRQALRDALNLIRRRDPIVSDDPEEDVVFALSKMTGLPVPEDMGPVAKKKFVADALDILRKSGPVGMDVVNDDTAKAFTSLAGIDFGESTETQQERNRKAVQRAIDRLRKTDPKVDEDPDIDLVKALSKVTGLPTNEHMTPFEKKKLIYDAIDILRGKDCSLENVDDATAKAISKFAGVKYEAKPESHKHQKGKALLEALKLLRSKNPDEVDEGMVEALSKITRSPVPQQMTTPEKKKFVSDCIDWLNKNEETALDRLDDGTAEDLAKLAGIDLGMDPSMLHEERKREAMQRALDLLRRNDPEVHDDPDENTIKALSKVTGLPVPEQLTPFQKKRFLYDAVDWLRKNDPLKLDTVDDTTAKTVTKLAGVEYEAAPVSKEEKKREAMQRALNMLRNSDPKVDDDPSEELVEALATITGLPVPNKTSPIEEKRFVVDSVDWLCKNDPVKLETVDDATARMFTKLAGVDYETPSVSPEERRRKVMRDALNSIRNTDPNISDNPDKNLVRALSKVTGAPAADEMTPFEKKKFVYDAIDTLRKTDHVKPNNTVDDAAAEALAQLAGINGDEHSMSPQERRRKAMYDALHSIRSSDPKVDNNPSENTVRALSKVTGLPMPEDMSPTGKKGFLEKSIAWLKKNDPVGLEDADDATAEAFINLAEIPNGGSSTTRTPEELKKKAMKDALNRIRNNFVDSENVKSISEDAKDHRTNRSLVSRSIETKGKETTPEEDVAKLYQEIRSLKTKATTLESTCEEQRAEIETKNNEIKKEKDARSDLQKSYDWAVEEHDRLYKKIGNVELELNLEKGKAQNFEKNLVAREQDSKLKKDQTDSRFQLQQERITDREQQLTSLYTAFGLISEECTEQETERATLQSILGEADSRVARQLQDELENETATTATNTTAATLSTPTPTRRVASTTNPASPGESPQNHSMSSPSGRTPGSNNGVPAFPSRSLPSFRVNRSSTRNLNMPSLEIDCRAPPLMEGYVHKFDRNVLKGWKKRYFSLYGSNGDYHLMYSTGPLEKIKGALPIVMGLSTAARTTEFLHQAKPYVIELRVDPHDSAAAPVYIATGSEQDLEHWLTALSIATEPKSPQDEQEAIDRQLARRMTTRIV